MRFARSAAMIFAMLSALAASSGAMAQSVGGCAFNTSTHQFAGTPQQQAACLLRKVKPKGSGSLNQPVPSWLNSQVWAPVAITPQKLQAYLAASRITSAEVGGQLANGAAPSLRYFVIHDTSYPEERPGPQGFPSNINDTNYVGNRLGTWAGKIRSRVNLIITRDGKSLLFQQWGATRALPAVKIEQTSISAPSRKYFVHVENVQPRLKSPTFAWQAPVPGFTPRQEERLALAYVVASYTAGRWLIPAYHFNIDQGLPDGHDDPQNTDLNSWAQKVETIANALR